MWGCNDQGDPREVWPSQHAESQSYMLSCREGSTGALRASEARRVREARHSFGKACDCPSSDKAPLLTILWDCSIALSQVHAHICHVQGPSVDLQTLPPASLYSLAPICIPPNPDVSSQPHMYPSTPDVFPTQMCLPHAQMCPPTPEHVPSTSGCTPHP